SRESAVQAHELAHAMCLYHPFHVQGRRVRLDHLLGHVQLLALDGVEELLSAVALSQQQQQRPSLWGQSQAQQQQQQPARVISCVPSVLLLTEQEALQLSSLHHKLLAAPDQQAFTAAAAAGAGARGQPTSSSSAGLSPVQAQAGPGYYARPSGYQLRDGQASAALDMDAEAWQDWAHACAASLGLPQLPAISPGVARLWQSSGHSSLQLDSSPAGGEEGTSCSGVGRQGTGQSAQCLKPNRTNLFYAPNPCLPTVSAMADQEESSPGAASGQQEEAAAVPASQPDSEPAPAAVDDELKGEFWEPLADLLPPSDCELVTPDGGVLKKVLKPGHGDPPGLYARCLGKCTVLDLVSRLLPCTHSTAQPIHAVHYLGRLQSSGSIFLDTKTESQSQQPVRVVAGRHTSPRESGLFKAVATMKAGERAAIYVQDPTYGYGEAGSFSFPAVPPGARLTYELECVDFEEAEDEVGGAAWRGVEHSGTSRVSVFFVLAQHAHAWFCVHVWCCACQDGESSGNLMYEERLERAEKRRLTGNQLFAEGKYREAMGKYATALSYLDEDFMMQLEGFYEDKANEVKVPIHLNMAACQLRIKDYHTAVYNCSEVLKLQPGNVKALFRRGTARHALGQTEGAKADLTAAAEKVGLGADLHPLPYTIGLFLPMHTPRCCICAFMLAIRAELQALRQTLRAEREAEATLFKGQFKFADPKPSTVGTQEEQQVHSSQDTAQPGSGSSHPALPLVAQPASLLSRALAGLWGLCSWLAAMFGMLLGIKVPVEDR
ncbi:hypothetical protein QJQ45_018036, partial [Haematococcus lacustris]